MIRKESNGLCYSRVDNAVWVFEEVEVEEEEEEEEVVDIVVPIEAVVDEKKAAISPVGK